MADRFAELGLVTFTVLGWALSVYVILALPVSPGAEAVLYAAAFVAIAGTAALVLGFYYARTRAADSRPKITSLLAGGMRLAFAVEFALWLQSLRVLTAAYLVFILAGFLFMEALFRYAG